MLRLIWTAADALTYDGTYTNESLSYVVGLFVLNSPNAYAHYTYGAIVRLDVDEFAQARWFLYRFDPVNGHYLGRDEFDGAGLGIPVSLSQSLDRSVWVQQQTSNRIRGAVFPGYALKSHYWDSNYWTGSAVSYQGYLIDLQRDRAILAHNGTPLDQVDVYKLSDGSLVSSHKVAGVPQAIFAEDDTRVFVMSDEGVITLLDYEDGGVLGVIRHTPASGVIEQHLVWDSYLRRVVALHWTAESFPVNNRS